MPENDQRTKAMDNVRSDIINAFADSLTPDNDAGGFRIELSRGDRDSEGALPPDVVVATSDEVVAVPWVYPCVHIGEFLGVAPTFIRFELSGVTFVPTAGASDNWKYHRYIDFLYALQQMGVTLTRPTLTSEEYRGIPNPPAASVNPS